MYFFHQKFDCVSQRCEINSIVLDSAVYDDSKHIRVLYANSKNYYVVENILGYFNHKKKLSQSYLNRYANITSLRNQVKNCTNTPRAARVEPKQFFVKFRYSQKKYDNIFLVKAMETERLFDAESRSNVLKTPPITHFNQEIRRKNVTR